MNAEFARREASKRRQPRPATETCPYGDPQRAPHDDPLVRAPHDDPLTGV